MREGESESDSRGAWWLSGMRVVRIDARRGVIEFVEGAANQSTQVPIRSTDGNPSGGLGCDMHSELLEASRLSQMELSCTATHAPAKRRHPHPITNSSLQLRGSSREIQCRQSMSHDPTSVWKRVLPRKPTVSRARQFIVLSLVKIS